MNGLAHVRQWVKGRGRMLNGVHAREWGEGGQGLALTGSREMVGGLRVLQQI